MRLYENLTNDELQRLIDRGLDRDGTKRTELDLRRYAARVAIHNESRRDPDRQDENFSSREYDDHE